MKYIINSSISISEHGETHLNSIDIGEELNDGEIKVSEVTSSILKLYIEALKTELKAIEESR